MKRADMYKEERRKGLTYQAIADKYGVSKQAVQQVCGKDNGLHFRAWDTKDCIYPNCGNCGAKMRGVKNA